MATTIITTTTTTAAATTTTTFRTPPTITIAAAAAAAHRRRRMEIIMDATTTTPPPPPTLSSVSNHHGDTDITTTATISHFGTADDTDTPSSSNTIRTNDVLCGRGKVDHVGNAYFRSVVAEQLMAFKYHQSNKNRHGMNMVVQTIVQKVHDTNGRFMDQNWRGMWVELSEKERRQKVDRACRDAKKNSTITTLIPPTTTTTTTKAIKTKFNTATVKRSTSSSSKKGGLIKSGLPPPQEQSNQQQQQHLSVLPYDDGIVGTETGGTGSPPTPPQRPSHDNRDIDSYQTTTTTSMSPEQMARLYPLTSGSAGIVVVGNDKNHNHNNNSSTGSKKRNSRGQKRISAPPPPQERNGSVNDDTVNTAKSVVTTVTKTTPGVSSLSSGKQQQHSHQVGKPTCNDKPVRISNNTMNNSVVMDTSLSSFDKVTTTTVRTLSSTNITVPKLEFSCGSLTFDNSFVSLPHKTDNAGTGGSNKVKCNNHKNDIVVSTLRPQQQQQQQQQQVDSPCPNSIDVVVRKPPPSNNKGPAMKIDNSNTNKNIPTWTTASISSIPNDYMNKSVISEMDFSAISLDLYTTTTAGIDEGDATTEQCNINTNYGIDLPRGIPVRVSTNSTYSTTVSIIPTTTGTAQNTGPVDVDDSDDDPLSMLLKVLPRDEMSDQMMNNESSLMMDASVSLLDLHQSFRPSTMFDSSYNMNQSVSAVESSSSTATNAVVLSNHSERQQQLFRRTVQQQQQQHNVNRKTRVESETPLLIQPDRYDLLKREESVDTIIAGNLRRHSHVSISGSGSKFIADQNLSQSFNMSLDICALPSPNEDDDDDERETTTTTSIRAGQQGHDHSEHDQQEYLSPHQRSPEKKKVKDFTLSPSLQTNCSLNQHSSLWSSNEEMAINHNDTLSKFDESNLSDFSVPSKSGGGGNASESTAVSAVTSQDIRPSLRSNCNDSASVSSSLFSV